MYVVDCPTSDGLVRFEIAGSAVPEGEVEAVNPADALRKIKGVLGDAVTTIKAVSQQITDGVEEMNRKPTELEVEFGVKVDGEFGAMIATLGSGAHFSVKLKWTTD